MSGAQAGVLVHYRNPVTGWCQCQFTAADGTITTWAKARGEDWKRMPAWLAPVPPLRDAIKYTPRPLGPVWHSCDDAARPDHRKE